VEAELVKLRYFVGMTLEEAAEVLGISARTADNYWAHARAWLYRAIKTQVSKPNVLRQTHTIYSILN
jgi:DNA-directed RNA polymerase specialized sigma24 family protein